MNIGSFLKGMAGIISALTLIVVIVTVLSDILCLEKTQQVEPASLYVAKEDLSQADFINKLNVLEKQGFKTTIEPINSNIIKVSYLNENTHTDHYYSNKNLLPFVLISSGISYILYLIGLCYIE